MILKHNDLSKVCRHTTEHGGGTPCDRGHLKREKSPGAHRNPHSVFRLKSTRGNSLRASCWPVFLAPFANGFMTTWQILTSSYSFQNFSPDSHKTIVLFRSKQTFWSLSLTVYQTEDLPIWTFLVLCVILSLFVSSISGLIFQMRDSQPF